MKKNVFILALLSSSFAFSQVGFNTPDPKATVDIEAKNATGKSTNVDGLLIPRVDRERAQLMVGVPTSTLVYINSIATGQQAGIAQNIDTIGYYYYNGAAWVKLESANQNLNIYTADGTIAENRTVTQADKTLAFTANSVNAFSVDDKTFSVDAKNHWIGFGTTSPSSKFEIISDNEGPNSGNNFYFKGFGSSKEPSLILSSANGTVKSPANLKAGDYVGSLYFAPRANNTFNTATGSSISSYYRGDGTSILTDLVLRTSNKSRIYISEGGNIGVGTDVPTNLFHINSSTSGAVKIVDGTQGADKVLTSDADGVATWKVIPASGGTSENIYTADGTLAADRTVTQDDKTLAFIGNKVNAFSVNASTFSVDAENNRVGIGTNAPTNKLHINSSTSGAVKIVDGTQGADKVLTSDADGVATWKEIPASGGTSENIYTSDGTLAADRTVTQDNKTLAFTGNSKNAFSVDGATFSVDAGNNKVGIGTIDPTSELQVVGNEFRLGGPSSQAGTVANPLLRIHSNANEDGLGGEIRFNEDNTGYGYYLRHNTGPGTTYGLDGLAIGSASPGSYNYNPAKPGMFVSSYQDVGFGTSTPQTVFHVDAARDNNINSAPTAIQQANDFVITPLGTVGIGNLSPRGALDINKGDTNNHGLVLPTNANVNNFTNPIGGSVIPGTIIYDSTNDCVRFYKKTRNWSKCVDGGTVSPETGSITSLNCAGANNGGTLTSGIAASGVSSTISYNGGNGGNHNGQTAISSGVTGLTATLSAGNFNTGSGTLTYTITGTPNGSGVASFSINIGGQSCTLTRDVVTGAGTIESLNCAGANHIGTLKNTVPASGVSSTISYNGGNGGAYGAQSVNSSGVTGLTATLSAGNFNTGSGSLIYTITGTPNGTGMANFVINIGGQNCTLTRTVESALQAPKQIRFAHYGLSTVGSSEGIMAPITNQLKSINNYGPTGHYQGATGFTFPEITLNELLTSTGAQLKAKYDIINVGRLQMNQTGADHLRDFASLGGVLIIDLPVSLNGSTPDIVPAFGVTGPATGLPGASAVAFSVSSAVEFSNVWGNTKGLGNLGTTQVRILNSQLPTGSTVYATESEIPTNSAIWTPGGYNGRVIFINTESPFFDTRIKDSLIDTNLEKYYHNIFVYAIEKARGA